jgi:hypothetical protein
MSDRNAIQRAFDEFGRVAGFEKRSGSWYGRSEEIISVTNLQKSNYGPRYFLNQGFWLLALGEERCPKEPKCHIRIRMGSLAPDVAARLDELLNLDCYVTDDERFTLLLSLMNERLLPVIKRGSSIDGLRAMCADGLFKGAGIRGEAQQLLSL